MRRNKKVGHRIGKKGLASGRKQDLGDLDLRSSRKFCNTLVDGICRESEKGLRYILRKTVEEEFAFVLDSPGDSLCSYWVNNR